MNVQVGNGVTEFVGVADGMRVGVIVGTSAWTVVCVTVRAPVGDATPRASGEAAFVLEGFGVAAAISAVPRGVDRLTVADSTVSAVVSGRAVLVAWAAVAATTVCVETAACVPGTRVCSAGCDVAV